MDNTQDQEYALMHHIDCIPERDMEDYSEWYEDATSEADWIDNIDIQGIENCTGCNLVDSVHSMTLLKELFQKNKVLEKEWSDSEQRFLNLKSEYQKLTAQLVNERHNSNKYQKKLQYIKDNHEVFGRLKQAYLNMKYNEATGRTIKQISECSCQTREGALCDACIETEELKRCVNLQIENESMFALGDEEMIAIKKSDLSKLQDTVTSLKEMIEKREKSWSFNAERENRYKATISDLAANMEMLHSILAERCRDFPVIEVDSTAEMVQKENELLKKIIIKLERRHREMMRTYKVPTTSAFLNEPEKFMIRQLIKKYTNNLRITPRYPMLEQNRSLPASTNLTPRTSRSHQSPRNKLCKNRPQSVGGRDNIHGEGEPFDFNVPTLTLDTDIAVQPEKPFSPRLLELTSESSVSIS